MKWSRDLKHHIQPRANAMFKTHRGPGKAAADQLVSWIRRPLCLAPRGRLRAPTLGLVLPDEEKIALAKSLLSLFKQFLKSCDYKQTFNVVLSPACRHLRVWNSPLRTLADI